MVDYAGLFYCCDRVVHHLIQLLPLQILARTILSNIKIHWNADAHFKNHFAVIRDLVAIPGTSRRGYTSSFPATFPFVISIEIWLFMPEVDLNS